MRLFLNRNIFLFFLIVLSITARTQIPDTTNWLSQIPIMPDSLQNHDAVILSENTEIIFRISSYQNYSTMLLKTTTIQKKIKILSRKGLEYTKISIPQTAYTEIDTMDVYLIKPNGKIVKEKTETHEVSDPYGDSRLNRGYLRLSVPGAEIGDIVSFSIKMTDPVGGGYPIDIFFHQEIPILNSRTSLRFKNTVKFKIQGYNGLNVSATVAPGRDSLFQWNFPYLPAIAGFKNGIPENELPFCRFMITGARLTNTFSYITKLTPDSWGEAFERTVKGIDRSSPKKKKEEYFNEWISLLKNGCDTCGKLSLFYKAFSYINDSIKLVKSEERENYSSGYYLWQRSCDRFSLFILYKDLFRYFGYPGYFVFARDKFDGMLDVNWITSDFYSALYLAFKDENGILHYIYPKTDYRIFQIDEIDPNLMGTKAFLVSIDNAFDYSEHFLPATGCETNVYERYAQVKNLNDSNYFIVNSTYKGCVSTHFRIKEKIIGNDSLKVTYQKSLEEQLEDSRIDSVSFGKIEPLPPFSYTRRYSGSQKAMITVIDDSVFSFGLGDWLDHSIISTDLENRNLDYYSFFPFTEKFKIEYIFSKPVTLVNEKALNTLFDNDLFTYSLTTSKTAENKILVESVYCIKSSYIPVTSYSSLKELNLRQKQYKDARMMVQMKKENTEP